VEGKSGRFAGNHHEDLNGQEGGRTMAYYFRKPYLIIPDASQRLFLNTLFAQPTNFIRFSVNNYYENVAITRKS